MTTATMNGQYARSDHTTSSTFEALTTIMCKCRKHHRVSSTVVQCALGPVLETRLGGGNFAVLHAFDHPEDNGRRWHGASRVRVHLYSTIEEARSALAGMAPTPCSETCCGHGVVYVNRRALRS